MPKQYDKFPESPLVAGKKYAATFKTNAGDIVCELFADRCPVTVGNFVALAKDGFYDNTTFHRVIRDFMIQGGDPSGNGRGGPGYKWNDEKSSLAIPHEVGSLSMANAGPNSNGSQFFITHIKTDWLDGKHGVFGRVTKGQDVVDKIVQGTALNTVVIDES